MLLTWFLRRIKILAKLPKAWVPWFTLFLGCLAAVGTVLAGGAGWVLALVTGIGGSLMAPAFWEMFGKHVDKKIQAAPVTETPTV